MRKRKYNYNKIIDRRINIYLYIVYFVFIVIIIRLFWLMIIERKTYTKKLKEVSDAVIEKDRAPRGRIFDRNYNIIVDNKAVKMIVYSKDPNIKSSDEVKLAEKVSKYIDINYNKINDEIIKNYLLVMNYDKLKKRVSEKENKKFKEKRYTSNKINEVIKNKIKGEELNISEEDKKSAYLYYLMNKGYSYDEKIIKSKNISDQEYTYFKENESSLEGFKIKTTWERVYPYGDVFRSILGTVSDSEQGIPFELKEEYLKKGYSLDDRVGLSYLEKQYEDILKGTKNKYKKLNRGKLKLIEKGKRGKDIVLSIDINLQKEIESILDEEIIKAKSEPNTKYYDHSFVVIQNPNTGEILAMSGRKVEKSGDGLKTVDYTPALLTSPMTPGSVVKAASMLVGYNEGAIKIGEYMNDSCIKIASTPRKCSWRNLGRINDIDALALSSNVYQFKTAIRVAGSSYHENMPFKIYNNAFTTYRNMYHSFGLGVKTEIDLPVESTGYTSKNETPGLLLDFVMGQFETYTPIQLSQYISTVANNGKRLQPHLLKEVHESTNGIKLGKLVSEFEPKVLNTVKSEEKYFKRVKEGLHAVTMSSHGLGRNYIEDRHDPSGKTGTSQSFLDTNNDGVIDTETISTAFIGYAPTNNPNITFTVTSPDSSHPNSSINYNSLVNLHITKRVSKKYYELYE